MLQVDVPFLEADDDSCIRFLQNQSDSDLCSELKALDFILKVLDDEDFYNHLPDFYPLVDTYRDMVRAELARRFCDCYYSSLKSVPDTD